MSNRARLMGKIVACVAILQCGCVWHLHVHYHASPDVTVAVDDTQTPDEILDEVFHGLENSEAIGQAPGKP